MRKKRKGDDILHMNRKEEYQSAFDSRSSICNFKSHYSLEDYERLRKRCKEDGLVGAEQAVSSFRGRLAGIAATAPPCGSSLLISPGRGLKRKIGCIDAATQMGRKNKIEDDFDLVHTIGKGKFGSVYMCQSRVTGVEFACKVLCKGQEIVHREVEIMQHLSGHPGIVMLEAVYEDSEKFHLVMELCSGGRLIDQMVKEGRYSEHRAANIFKELMVVIKYCHEMGVVHRDIKPENILLTTSGKIKLADFGLAMRIANGQSLNGLAGSPAYVAPEVLLGDYSEKVDIWSAGVLLHALLTGILPFQGDTLKGVFDSIKNLKLDFHSGMWESVSKPARDLLDRILTRDVKARITADEVLRHPWILFYTERTIKPKAVKLKSKNHPFHPFQMTLTMSRLETFRSKAGINSFTKGAIVSLSGSLEEAGELDDSGLVDTLAVAISQVRISEPKRSRLCCPTSPIREQSSSNMKTNNLCKAF